MGIDLAIKHMKCMGIRFAEGRSQAAAKLHTITDSNDWSYEVKGSEIDITKKHENFREELFVPTGEDGYPVHNRDFQSTRITRGVTRSGKVFEIEDNWRRPGRASRRLDEAWTGHTVFRAKASARERLSVMKRGILPGDNR